MLELGKSELLRGLILLLGVNKIFFKEKYNFYKIKPHSNYTQALLENNKLNIRHITMESVFNGTYVILLPDSSTSGSLESVQL